MTDPAAIIAAALPADVAKRQTEERILALAASGHALVLDLGVDGLPDDQRAATEEQVGRIAAEIERLQTVADLPPADAAQAPTITARLAEVEADQVALREQVRQVGVGLAVAAGVSQPEAVAMIEQALT